MPLSGSLSSLIALQLPYLRRFARALTGSQASGDAYSLAALEALVEADEVPGDRAGVRKALFKVFLTIWTSIPIHHLADPVAVTQALRAADRNLEALTPMPRVAFLLRAQEGFESEEIADMMNIPIVDVEALIKQAGHEIAAQLSTDILIIEDEVIIAIDLEALVTDLGHRVTRIARTHKEAVAAFADKAPGLVLADIHLADGSSGLEAANEILTECQVPVIFITAYPERLLTGERPEPTFLITKPFRPETVMAIVSQALFFDRRALTHPAAAGV